jgi:hypothetical protein
MIAADKEHVDAEVAFDTGGSGDVVALAVVVEPVGALRELALEEAVVDYGRFEASAEVEETEALAAIEAHV